MSGQKQLFSPTEHKLFHLETAYKILGTFSKPAQLK